MSYYLAEKFNITLEKACEITDRLIRESATDVDVFMKLPRTWIKSYLGRNDVVTVKDRAGLARLLEAELHDDKSRMVEEFLKDERSFTKLSTQTFDWFVLNVIKQHYERGDYSLDEKQLVPEIRALMVENLRTRYEHIWIEDDKRERNYAAETIQKHFRGWWVRNANLRRRAVM